MNPLIIAILILVAALLALLFFYYELRERYRGLIGFAMDSLPPWDGKPRIDAWLNDLGHAESRRCARERLLAEPFQSAVRLALDGKTFDPSVPGFAQKDQHPSDVR